MVDGYDNSGHGHDGALEALMEVANGADRDDFGYAIDSFSNEDYEQIINLAWRYQFDDDRSKFKRDIRELQEHVSERILARLELNQ